MQYKFGSAVENIDVLLLDGARKLDVSKLQAEKRFELYYAYSSPFFQRNSIYFTSNIIIFNQFGKTLFGLYKINSVRDVMGQHLMNGKHIL